MLTSNLCEYGRAMEAHAVNGYENVMKKKCHKNFRLLFLEAEEIYGVPGGSELTWKLNPFPEDQNNPEQVKDEF